MSYQNEIESLSDLATAMFATPGNAPFNLTVGGLQAGAYAGVAIILIMTLGATAPAGIRALIMGSAFGLALILVAIGGAALFTGHNLYSSVAVAGKKLSLLNAIKLNTWVFVSNLVGTLLLLVIYWMGQGPLTHGHCSCRTWSSVQLAGMPCLMDGETSRKQLSQMHCYAWCVLAFIAAGFEHSVANMTVHLLALFGAFFPVAEPASRIRVVNTSIINLW